MAFPDPSTPIATCRESSCDDCPVAEKIHCHFRLSDYLHFLLISSPSFLLAGVELYRFSPWSLGLYLVIVVGFFGFLEIRVMCSHCPHYAEKGKTLTCWANHGSPKLWKYRPGPMSTTENLLFFFGLILVWGFPLPVFIFNTSWMNLALYLLTSCGFFVTLKLFLCSKCMNFACPLNGVDQKDRELFYQYNPSVARHWPNHIGGKG